MNRRRMRGIFRSCVAAAAAVLVLAQPVDGTRMVYATSGNEVEMVQTDLTAHGLQGGISDLLELAAGVGKQVGLSLKVTCDAKYLEVGVLNKSDNVDALLHNVILPRGIRPEECAYWGDEYLELANGLNGSDSFMHTILSSPGDFFDVGTVPGIRPQWVRYLGGSIHTFLSFLREQAAL